MEGTPSTGRTRARPVSIIGQVLLVVLGTCWGMFSRPAPVVNVTWRAGVSEALRLADEQQLHLTNREASDNAFHYELLTPDFGGIDAIVAHPDIQDTSHIIRREGRIAADAGVGPDRVWWWAGPFRGAGGEREFRIVFAALLLLTAGCGWAARPAS